MKHPKLAPPDEADRLREIKKAIQKGDYARLSWLMHDFAAPNQSVMTIEKSRFFTLTVSNALPPLAIAIDKADAVATNIILDNILVDMHMPLVRSPRPMSALAYAIYAASLHESPAALAVIDTLLQRGADPAQPDVISTLADVIAHSPPAQRPSAQSGNTTCCPSRIANYVFAHPCFCHELEEKALMKSLFIQADEHEHPVQPPAAKAVKPPVASNDLYDIIEDRLRRFQVPHKKGGHGPRWG